VSSRKRDRAQARKRHDKWVARQAVAHQRHQRNVALGWSLFILATLAVVVLVTRPSPPPPVDASQTEEAFDDAAAQGEEQDDATSADPEQDPAAEDPTAEDPAAEDPAAEASQDPQAEQSGDVPDPSLAENRTWTGEIQTNQGLVSLELDGQAAPQAVANFVKLAGDGFFDSTDCHRLTTAGIFVLQCGNPLGLEGDGGPGYSFGPVENAPSDDVYPAGTLAMARVGGDGNSMGSQFFIVYQDSTIPSDSAGGYTVFGRVTEGLEVVQAIADGGAQGGGDGPPTMPVTIERVQFQ
jgi:peptidyl-prolyl cis-trans isomerase B (cyclophilin B)